MTKPLSYRLFLAAGIGSIAFAIAAQTSGTDFAGRSMIPLRELIGGHDPYMHTFTWLDVPYPLPAMLIGLPFLPFSNSIAGSLFVAITSSLLALALTQDGVYWRLLIFTSYPFLESVVTVQYAPLMALALALPASLAWPLMLIKPQVALAGVVMDKPAKRSLIITAIILLASLLIIPLWPLEWLRSIPIYQSMIPLLAPLGFVLVLALVHWRKREYRGLLALAVLPKRGMYDHLYIGLLARDVRELVAYVSLSWLPVVAYDVLGVNTAVLLYLVPLVIWLWKDRRLAKICTCYSRG